MTNYEWIKQMSVEELAVFFMNSYGHDILLYCDPEKPIEVCGNLNCLDCAKEWLESEVTDNA